LDREDTAETTSPELVEFVDDECERVVIMGMTVDERIVDLAGQLTTSGPQLVTMISDVL